MPNWCYTDYRFYADTDVGKEQLAKFYATLTYAIREEKRRILRSDFGDKWLGNVILEFCPQNFTLTKDSITCTYNGTDVRFRGSIIYLEITDEDTNDPYISVQTETAWEPMYDMWDMILAECGFTDIKYVYSSEEPGMGIYINTDKKGKFFSEKYRVEVYISDEFYCNETQYFNSDKEALDYLNEVIKNLREEYKHNSKAYSLPQDYSTRGLRKQQSINKALEVLEKNLFSWHGCDGYVSFAEYTSE